MHHHVHFVGLYILRLIGPVSLDFLVGSLNQQVEESVGTFGQWNGARNLLARTTSFRLGKLATVAVNSAASVAHGISSVINIYYRTGGRHLVLHLYAPVRVNLRCNRGRAMEAIVND